MLATNQRYEVWTTLLTVDFAEYLRDAPDAWKTTLGQHELLEGSGHLLFGVRKSSYCLWRQFTLLLPF